MNLTVEQIQKYDKIVREKFQTAVMKKISPISLTWTDSYRIVASIRVVKGKVVFKFEE